ncbi:MAG: hypothetical protein IJV22_03645 [Bacteroidales bacterium]|nr:hypothetical protein [Bacteroidales bacterium]
MKLNKSTLYITTLILLGGHVFAQETSLDSKMEAYLATKSQTTTTTTTQTSQPSRLTIGGYGEAVYRYNAYSSDVFRYSHADRHKDDKGHGQVDLPHAVIMMGYDFGHGWSFGTEIEFEHGGVEAAVEMEDEEAGEYEKEIERGGEVALEQFWLQRKFSDALHVRMGHMVVPVGATNNAHLPTEFFGVYRPEGENTVLPCTWHETGISLWGQAGGWRYEAMLLPALNSTMFNTSGWANGASASAYEFRAANNLAIAARVDNTSIPNLRLSLSGYIGNTFNNDIAISTSSRYADVKGTVAIGAFDFLYKTTNFVARGNADYGYLSDATLISAYNTRLSNSTGSPYPHMRVGQAAYTAGAEIGYNLMHAAQHPERKLFIFGRYDIYDSYVPAEDMVDIEWTYRQCITLGVNYRPLPQIVVKAECGYRWFKEQYNNEPFVAIGITWSGMFNR